MTTPCDFSVVSVKERRGRGADGWSPEPSAFSAPWVLCVYLVNSTIRWLADDVEDWRGDDAAAVDQDLHAEADADPADLEEAAAHTGAAHVRGRQAREELATLDQHRVARRDDDAVMRIAGLHVKRRHRREVADVHAVGRRDRLREPRERRRARDRRRRRGRFLNRGAPLHGSYTTPILTRWLHESSVPRVIDLTLRAGFT